LNGSITSMDPYTNLDIIDDELRIHRLFEPYWPVARLR
jgi:hypothetical protein